MGLFLLTIVFSLVYVFLYPGLGRYAGHWQWSSEAQWKKEVAELDAKLAPLYQQYKDTPIPTLANDAKAREMGRRLFLQNCSVCHGSDGQGSFGVPNLADEDWIYGGEPEAIEQSIALGRQAMMPPMGSAVGGEDGIAKVAQYVLHLNRRATSYVQAAEGEALFKQNCAVCHGPTGEGMPALGCPNLTRNVWRYGSSAAAIATTIREGRSNQMPSFAALLSPAKIHVLAAYVYHLSHAREGQ